MRKILQLALWAKYGGSKLLISLPFSLKLNLTIIDYYCCSVELHKTLQCNQKSRTCEKMPNLAWWANCGGTKLLISLPFSSKLKLTIIE